MSITTVGSQHQIKVINVKEEMKDFNSSSQASFAQCSQDMWVRYAMIGSLQGITSS